MLNILYSILITFFVNINIVLEKYSLNYFFVCGSVFLLIIVIFIFPSIGRRKIKSRRLIICRNGYCQASIFILSGILVIVADVFMYLVLKMEFNLGSYIVHAVVVALVEITLFLSGIIRMYIFSKQLGLTLRIVGLFTWYIPIVNFVVLYKIIRKVKDEVEYENNKLLLNEARRAEKVCKTKYPLLLVHGVFFRDYKYFNYWGRIPEELEKNGAKIYYGEHQSASSIENSSKELFDRIKKIVNETGCKKLNIISHSKGGLDSKYLLTYPEIEEYIASITTISTPHKGCMFADYLFSKIPDKLLNSIADKYNKALKKMGDNNPDFIAATKDLTTSSCKEIDEKVKLKENIFCQSVGSKLNKAIKGSFPLNYTGVFVKYFDGANDGLVGEESFKWGDNYIFVKSDDKRGISHGDIIDLNRENINGFDVREFYVQLVHDLKNRGF